MALAQRSVENARLRWVLALIGIAGACLFFGDGIITPAISVLSAVEGLKVVSPHLEKAVLPISVVILVALFLVQYRGTAKMGAIFGPICAAWFLVLGLLGLWEVLHNPGVLAAISPHWAITFCLHYRLMAFIAFREEVILRRSRHRLAKARERGHLLIGLAIAVANLDEVIRVIREIADAPAARAALIGIYRPDRRLRHHHVTLARHQVHAAHHFVHGQARGAGAHANHGHPRHVHRAVIHGSMIHAAVIHLRLVHGSMVHLRMVHLGHG
jgi:hypothetical protein